MEKTALNKEQKQGVDWQKVWDEKVAEIRQAISTEMKVLTGACTWDSWLPTTQWKDKVRSSQHHHKFPNSPQTPMHHVSTFSKSLHLCATPSRFANASVSHCHFTLKAPFNTVDPSSGPSHLNFWQWWFGGRLWTQWQWLWLCCQCWGYCSIIKHTTEE